jgi:hypothetical protein
MPLYNSNLICIQGSGGTTSSNFFTNALISSTTISQYHNSLDVNSHITTAAAAAGALDITRHTSIIMHHANPHNALLPQPQHILHQPIRVERAPAKPKHTHLLHPLDHAPAPPPSDDETDRREPQVRVRRRLAEDRDVSPGPQVREEDFLQCGLVGLYRGPRRRARGSGGAEVGADAGDRGCQLVVGGCEAELAFEGGGGVEVVA